ncbi:LysR family transcriptional regulator, partial [Mesorhizobium sp. M4A.F.Ca.ET.050.02.1.1]
RREIGGAPARHICESLDNISVPLGEETGNFDFAALAFTKMKRTKANQIMPGW